MIILPLAPPGASHRHELRNCVYRLIYYLDLIPVLGGNMGWKKALFFGGAVLVLAACSDSATSPSALRQSEGAASFMLPPMGTITTTSDSTATPLPTIGLCTGIVIRTGAEADSSSTSSCPVTF